MEILAKNVLCKLLADHSSQIFSLNFFFHLSVFDLNHFTPPPTPPLPNPEWNCGFAPFTLLVLPLKSGNNCGICSISTVYMNWEYVCKTNVLYCNSLIISITLSRKVLRNLNRKYKLEWWKDWKVNYFILACVTLYIPYIL